MSRSYAKKSRYFNTIRYFKKQAVKKFRKERDFDVDGNKYKRLYCSWKINDGGRARPFPKPNTKENINDKIKAETQGEIWWPDRCRRK